MRRILLYFLLLLRSACNVYILLKLWSLITNSPAPVIVVISDSMAPTFHRGDILFLQNWQSTVEVGDIPVVWFPGRNLPMVHRCVKVNWSKAEEERLA